MASLRSIRPVTHVVFDVDGLLLDTESIYTRIMNTVAGRYGKTFTWDVKVKQMGKKHQESAKVFIEELSVPITVEEYGQQVRELSDQYFAESDLMPGAEKLVNHLHKHNVPMALATGSYAKEFQLKITKHKKLFEKFHHTVCSSDDPDVKHGKPAPDCFLVAASRFPDQPSPEKVLVFEDAPNGVEGALAAKMQVVWIPDERCLQTADDSIRQLKSTLLLKSLEEFKPEVFGLPPYDN